MMTFRDFASEWQESVLGSYRSSTRKFYKSTLERWLLPYWSQWRLADIKLMDVRKWLGSHAATYSTSVIKHMRATLADAVDMGELVTNPAKGFRTPHGKAVRRAATLTSEQIGIVLDKLQEPLRTAVRLVSILGMRESELARLRVSDLDFLNKTIAVRQSRYRGQTSETKTEGSTRGLPMPSTVEGPLRMLAETCPSPEGLLFCTLAGKGLNLDNVTGDVFRPLTERAKIPAVLGVASAVPSAHKCTVMALGSKSRMGSPGNSIPHVSLGNSEASPEDMRAAVEGVGSGLFPNCSQVRKPVASGAR